jgi:hypothetical protein
MCISKYVSISRYSKGRRREYQTIDWLQERGFECVRAAGSKGVFDIVAFSFATVLLVQVKCNRKPSGDELLDMLAVPAPENARRLVFVWTDGIARPKIGEVSVSGELLNVGREFGCS